MLAGDKPYLCDTSKTFMSRGSDVILLTSYLVMTRNIDSAFDRTKLGDMTSVGQRDIASYHHRELSRHGVKGRFLGVCDNAHCYGYADCVNWS